ncbi:hypothetical protein O181_078268, partial [Austropuccinia psidii MF-1]|nr:hypothetical protein [Austropuccinia psidii MF-1]
MQILVTQDVPSIGMMISNNKPMLAMMVEWMISQEDSLNQFLRRVTSSRYLSLRDVYTTHEDFSLACLLDMSEREFKESVWMSQHSFFQIYDMIKTSHLFQKISYCPQPDLCHQSALTLEPLGSNGNGESIGRLASTYQISRGVVVNVSRRVIGALFELGCQFLQWTNQAIQEEILSDMASEGFLGCVGFLDGTTIPLFQRPGIDGEMLQALE